jgi:hypothetical protein
MLYHDYYAVELYVWYKKYIIYYNFIDNIINNKKFINISKIKQILQKLIY